MPKPKTIDSLLQLHGHMIFYLKLNNMEASNEDYSFTDFACFDPGIPFIP